MTKILLSLSLAIPLAFSFAVRADEPCDKQVRRTLAGEFVDLIKLIGYEKALQWKLLTTNKSDKKYFDKIMEVHARGQVGQAAIEVTLLEGAIMFSGDARQEMILWFGKHGNRDSARRLERAIAKSTNKYKTNTEGYLYESLLEVVLQQGRVAVTFPIKEHFEGLDDFWLREYLLEAKQRADNHPDIYSDADRAKRDRLFWSFDYKEQEKELVKVLESARRTSKYEDLQGFLFSTVYGYGVNSSVGRHNSGIYAFNDSLFELGFEGNRDSTAKWKNPFVRFLDHVMNKRLVTEHRARTNQEVYANTISITLNWIADHPDIWTGEFKEEFVKLLAELNPWVIDSMKRLRPELVGVLTVRDEAFLRAWLETPSGLRPRLLTVNDL